MPEAAITVKAGGCSAAGLAFLRHCTDAQKQFYNEQLTEHGHKLAWRLTVLPEGDAKAAPDGPEPQPALFTAEGLKQRPRPVPRA